MPFDWYKVKIPEDFKKKIEVRFVEMHLREIIERARLLFNLHYPKEMAIKRIQDNIAWDFELSKVPSFYNDVPAIVERIYSRKSPYDVFG
jgi:hypothetical protein